MTLKTCAGAPRYILPSRCDVDTPMSGVSFNPVTSAIAERAGKGGPPLELFTMHDVRRKASTFPQEMHGSWSSIDR